MLHPVLLCSTPFACALYCCSAWPSPTCYFFSLVLSAPAFAFCWILSAWPHPSLLSLPPAFAPGFFSYCVNKEALREWPNDNISLLGYGPLSGFETSRWRWKLELQM